MPGKSIAKAGERQIRIGRKRALYLPREILEAAGLREGDMVTIRVEGKRLVIERAPDPFLLAVEREKWASTTVEEFEEESESEQKEWD